MKTLSGRFKLVALVAVGVVAVLALRVFAVPSPHEPDASKATFVLKIKNVTAVQDEDNFVNVLKGLKSQLYCVHMKHSQGHKPPLEEDITGGPNTCAQLDIKTDKVTTSETAKSASGEELTAIQLHATIQIPSMYASDIKAVLDALP